MRSFESKAHLRGTVTRGGLETFSILLLDLDYNGSVFQLHTHVYAKDMEAADWHAWLPVEDIGEKMMAIFMDIYGNEASIVLSREDLKLPAHVAQE